MAGMNAGAQKADKKTAGESFLWQQTPNERKMVMSSVKAVRERRFTIVACRKTVAREEEAAPFHR